MERYEIIGTSALKSAPAMGLQAIPESMETLYTRFINYTDVKDTTLRNYTAYIRRFLDWLREENIAQPSRETIKAYKEYLNGQEYSAGTRQQYLRAVKHFFKWTSCEGLYPNIGDGIKTAKVKADNTKKEAFSVDDMRAVLESVDRSTETGKRDYCILLLAVTGALRINEIRLADIGDIQTIRGQRVLYIQGKGHDSKDDYKKLVPALVDAIDDYLATRPGAKKSDPLFTSTSNRSKGQRITEPSVSRLIKQLFIAAGYDSSKLTAHSLRHTSNTLLFKAGADLYQVQHHARHQNPATTEIYLHAEERDKDQSELQIYNELFGVSRELSQREKLQEILAKLSDDQIEELAPIVTRFYENL